MFWVDGTIDGHERRSSKETVDSGVSVHFLEHLTCNLRYCTCLKIEKIEPVFLGGVWLCCITFSLRLGHLQGSTSRAEM